MTAHAFPLRSVVSYEVLSGGLINTNLKVRFETGGSVVLRIYRDGSRTLEKEFALHRLVDEVVPVARFLSSAPHSSDEDPAFALLEYVEGITFQQLTNTGDREAISQAAYSAGKTLAAVGRFQFEKPGRISADETSGKLMIGESFLNDSEHITTLVDSFLESPILQQRMGPELSNQLQAFFRAWAPQLLDLNQDSSLVHCDFGNRNIMVAESDGKWEVSAVLDWELAFSGSPLLDVGHFLRHDYANPVREPHFSKGFLENGGRLPDDWSRIVRVIDLTGLVECLRHPELPGDVEDEILQLITSTLSETNPG